MLNIMKFLTKELKKINPKVYNERALSTTLFPYVVFKIRNSSLLENDREDVIVEVDIWDIQKDGYDAIVNIELLTDKIDKFLKNVRHNDENQVLIFSRIGRLNLLDEDSNIKRRQLRYLVKSYEKNQ